MGIDINTFFEFPGILITIGAVLLLISIILIIIAYKSLDKPVVEIENNNIEEPNVKNQKENIVTEDKEEINKEESNDEYENENDGFDLTKVFETSSDENNEFTLEEIKFDKEVVEDKVENNDTEEEEEIELL